MVWGGETGGRTDRGTHATRGRWHRGSRLPCSGESPRSLLFCARWARNLRASRREPLKRHWGLGTPKLGAQPPQGGAHPSRFGVLPPGDAPPPAQSPGVSEGKASALWANVSATSSGKTREASA